MKRAEIMWAEHLLRSRGLATSPHIGPSLQLSTALANTNQHDDFPDVRTGTQRNPCLQPNNNNNTPSNVKPNVE